MWDNDWPISTEPSNPTAQVPEGTTAIVVPMRNGMKFFKLLYYSLLYFTDRPWVMAVVDNMSDLHVKKALRSMSVRADKNAAGETTVVPRFTVLRYDKPFNFAAQVNMGLEFLFQNRRVKFGCIINSDAVVEPYWLSGLLTTFKEPRLENLGIVGPTSDQAIPEQQKLKQPLFEGTARLSGFCMVFKREVFERTSGFDEGFEGGGFEDWDFCERARGLGYSVGVNRSVHVKHFYKCSRRHPDDDRRMNENKQRFISKYPQYAEI